MESVADGGVELEFAVGGVTEGTGPDGGVVDVGEGSLLSGGAVYILETMMY